MARLAAAAGAAAAALIVAAIAIWYLGQALILGLEAAPLGPAVARVVAGAIGLVAVGLLGVAAKLALGRRHVTVKTTVPISPTADAAAQLGGLVAQQLLANAVEHPYGAAGAALAAGLAVGAIPELRDLLKGVVKH